MKFPWQNYLAEFIGTALRLVVGLSFVILDFGVGSPVVHWLPDAGLRRALTGFLFGTTGALIAISYVGKISGAHINPVVTLAFMDFLKSKILQPEPKPELCHDNLNSWHCQKILQLCAPPGFQF